MNEIQIFSNNEFGDIRTVILDGEPWFVAMDISEKLGYAQTANMLKQVDKEDKRKVLSSDLDDTFSKFAKEISVINESGLYDAIFGSKLKNAKSFKRWVTKEVLPSIRKTGSYGQPQLPENPMELLELHYQALKQVDKKVESVSAEMDNVKADLESLKMDLPIFPLEESRIKKAINKKALCVIGGKESNAYHNRSIVAKVYRDIYGQIYRNFGIGTYKALRRKQCDKAIEVVEKYEPPVILAERIQNENAQQKMQL